MTDDNHDARPMNVSILDKDYRVSCPPGEQSALLESARYLDGRMREVRDSGKIIGAERIAVITALNMANDLLQSGNVERGIGRELPPRLKHLENRITQALEQARQPEI